MSINFASALTSRYICILSDMDIMELAFTLIVLLMAELAVLALLAVSGGVASAFGVPFRCVFLNGLWLLLLPPLAVAYGALVERNWYKVNEVEIPSDRLPASFDGYRIVQISDMHLRSFDGRAGSLRRAVEKINALEPDAVLFTGDIVTFGPSEMDGMEEILSGIKAKDGVYSVRGNHDYCMYGKWADDAGRRAAIEEVVERQRRMGWNVLLNSNVNIVRTHLPEVSGEPVRRDTISIIGVENTSQSRHFPTYGSLERALEGADGVYRILMSHDPTHWSYNVSYRKDIDLTLSGHTHSMQLAFFGWSPSNLMFREYAGLYGGPDAIADGRSGNWLYVNVGLGETAMPARIGVRPEITLLTLRKTEY